MDDHEEDEEDEYDEDEEDEEHEDPSLLEQHEEVPRKRKHTNRTTYDTKKQRKNE